MQARQAPEQPAPPPEPPANPLDMLQGITPQMIDSMDEQTAKGILAQLVSTLQPTDQSTPPAPPMQ